MKRPFVVHKQDSAYESPWSLSVRIKILLWEYVWAFFCAWTPKPFNRWRVMWLVLFGCTAEGITFVHSRARVVRPWNLTMRHRSCLGDGAVAYCLDKIEICAGATVAQEAYICTGTHDFNDEHLPLKTSPIVIGAHAFVGLRAIVLPGVSIAPYSVIGAGSVVTKDNERGEIYAGNPAIRIGTRVIKNSRDTNVN